MNLIGWLAIISSISKLVSLWSNITWCQRYWRRSYLFSSNEQKQVLYISAAKLSVSCVFVLPMKCTFLYDGFHLFRKWLAFFGWCYAFFLVNDLHYFCIWIAFFFGWYFALFLFMNCIFLLMAGIFLIYDLLFLLSRWLALFLFMISIFFLVGHLHCFCLWIAFFSW